MKILFATDGSPHALAAEQRYDLIAMGTHGHTALANLVLGSVATKVLATAPVPVLLLR